LGEVGEGEGGKGGWGEFAAPRIEYLEHLGRSRYGGVNGCPAV
jgi:hypothetical protein